MSIIQLSCLNEQHKNIYFKEKINIGINPKIKAKVYVIEIQKFTNSRNEN